MEEDILLNCHLTIHKLNVRIKRNAFYNFQIDESFMGRCNENKDVFYAGENAVWHKESQTRI
jgi:hypothetical protein